MRGGGRGSRRIPWGRRHPRAINSAARVPPLQGGSRGFESLIAHQPSGGGPRTVVGRPPSGRFARPRSIRRVRSAASAASAASARAAWSERTVGTVGSVRLLGSRPAELPIGSTWATSSRSRSSFGGAGSPRHLRARTTRVPDGGPVSDRACSEPSTALAVHRRGTDVDRCSSVDPPPTPTDARSSPTACRVEVRTERRHPRARRRSMLHSSSSEVAYRSAACVGEQRERHLFLTDPRRYLRPRSLERRATSARERVPDPATRALPRVVIPIPPKLEQSPT